MITLSTDPEIAREEAGLRQWYEEELGASDADELVKYLWRKHREQFVPSMRAIKEQTELNGRGYLHRLLRHTRKDPIKRDAEEDIREWFTPRLHLAIRRIVDSGATREAVAAEMDGLMHGLEEKLYNMFPDKHRATMKGAMLAALSNVGGGIALDVDTLVEALFLDDPLAASAKASR